MDRDPGGPKTCGFGSGTQLDYVSAQVKEAKKSAGKAYHELEQRVEREGQLAVLQRKMEVRALLRGGRNKPQRLIQEETKGAAPVYLWPKERKK
jgi:U3 small nucleolar RNA-associated protein 11